jgi:hypothetical protein
MMRCETCSQEYTAFDFVSLRNLCEHLYLDSLAQKVSPPLPRQFHSLNLSQSVPPRKAENSEPVGELVSLDQ